MIKKITILLLLTTGIILQIEGQLTVADNNNVGIGVTAPLSKLSIGSVGNSNTSLYVENSSTTATKVTGFYKTASGTTSGIWSFGSVTRIFLNNGGSRLVGGHFYAYNSTDVPTQRSYGIYSLAGNGASGYNYGVWARLAGSNNGAALFATTGTDYEINTGGQYAGYFRGDVKMEDDLIVFGDFSNPSDINLKKDIKLLSDEETSQVDKLMTLSAIKYKYKTPAELDRFDKVVLDTASVDPRTIEYTDDKYTKDRIGLSAQEVQMVYPELVKEGSDGFLSLNYVGLIPVLVDALKEQEAARQKQEAEIEVLRQEIEKLKDTSKTK